MAEAKVTTVATSAADALAFAALADVCILTAAMNVRIVGGQMVALLVTAFPTARAVFRRTADADVAISAQVASSGDAQRALELAGYRSTSGNSYEKADQHIDLLVPSSTGRFGSTVLGGRRYDAAPGLLLALASDPIDIEVEAQLKVGIDLTFHARVPSVEVAIILKAAAYAGRREPRDLIDLHNLLLIVDEYDPTLIGGWSLGERAERGARRDSQTVLHELANDLSRGRNRREELEVRTELIVALIRGLVAAG